MDLLSFAKRFITIPPNFKSDQLKCEVYIVDDDMVSQFATRYTLEQASPQCKFVTFDNMEAVLELLLKHMENREPFPQVILLDLTMPGMSGWEFLEQFEKLLQNRKKPNIFILSAFQSSKDRLKAKEHPLIQGYFDKPLSKVNADKILLAIAGN